MRAIVRYPGFGALHILAVMTAFPAPASAQLSANSATDWRSVPHFGIGYMGGAPHAILGGTAYIVRPWLGGFGLLVDFHISHQSWEGDEEFTNAITRDEARAFGDTETRTNEHWAVFNVGVIRPLTRDFALFGGAGIGRAKQYREYFDGSGTRGVGGHYRINDEDASGNHINVVGGGLFRFGEHLNFHFGAERAPAGFLVGVTYVHSQGL